MKSNQNSGQNHLVIKIPSMLLCNNFNGLPGKIRPGSAKSEFITENFVDPHSCYLEPDPAEILSADPDIDPHTGME
jgi:hypothetical protein